MQQQGVSYATVSVIGGVTTDGNVKLLQGAAFGLEINNLSEERTLHVSISLYGKKAGVFSLPPGSSSIVLKRSLPGQDMLARSHEGPAIEVSFEGCPMDEVQRSIEHYFAPDPLESLLRDMFGEDVIIIGDSPFGAPPRRRRQRQLQEIEPGKIGFTFTMVKEAADTTTA